MDTRSGPVPSRRGSGHSLAVRGTRGMVTGWLVTLGFGLVAGRLLTLRMSPHPDADVTTEALTVLLIYFGLGAVILGLLDWYRPDGARVPDDVAEGAAMTAVAAGGPP